MTAWLLAVLIQSAQAQTITTVADYPTHYRVTSGYVNGSVVPIISEQRSIFPTTSHKLSRGFSGDHSGMDIDGNAGDAILAWQNGVVEEISSTGPYGNKIIIRHDDATTSVYAHLETVTVQLNEAVRAGSFIGTLGSTGRATGSHLHFEIRLNDSTIDPLPYLASAR